MNRLFQKCSHVSEGENYIPIIILQGYQFLAAYSVLKNHQHLDIRYDQY